MPTTIEEGAETTDEGIEEVFEVVTIKPSVHLHYLQPAMLLCCQWFESSTRKPFFLFLIHHLTLKSSNIQTSLPSRLHPISQPCQNIPFFEARGRLFPSSTHLSTLLSNLQPLSRTDPPNIDYFKPWIS